MAETSTRHEAQKRADRIRAFREELTTLADEGANPLTPEQQARLSAHHDALMARLAATFDVDRSEQSGRFSKGMVLASLFGAATLILSIYSFVERAWWGMDLPAQTTLLTMFPLIALVGVEVAARRDRTRYVAAGFALVACATAWLAVAMIARLLDLPFAVLMLWPGILVGLGVALSYGFSLVFGVSLAAATLAIAGAFFASGGVPWTAALMRLEPLMITSLLLAAVGGRFEAAGDGFGQVARVVGTTIGLASVLALSFNGALTLLPLSRSVAEGAYQVGMVAASVLIIGSGLRRRQQLLVTVAAILFAVFLLARYFDWFWDVLPAWLFYLILAALAFASLALLQRLRARVERP